MVVCQPPFSMPLLSSPSPEKLPNENVLLVGETSRWSSWSRNGTPILLGRLFPVWWNGIEPFLSRSSLRLLNYIHERRKETQDKGDISVSTGYVWGRGLTGHYWVSSSNRGKCHKDVNGGRGTKQNVIFSGSLSAGWVWTPVLTEKTLNHQQ